jgi:hypothetical protein
MSFIILLSQYDLLLQALLGKDVDAEQQAEALAKMWGLDWLNKTPVW